MKFELNCYNSTNFFNEICTKSFLFVKDNQKPCSMLNLSILCNLNGFVDIFICITKAMLGSFFFLARMILYTKSAGSSILITARFIN